MGDKLSVVTGATGHVGYALVKELEARGENFRILIRKDSKIFDGINCERVFGDVTDPASLEKAFEGADVVYHLAGVIEINKGNEDMTWKVNVDGTKNVVEACKKCGVKRLVYASSVDAYPPLPDNQVMREISHFNPEILDGTYAKTKATATNYVFENNDDKLETVVCYPGACCGPYDFKVSSVGEMVRMFLKGKFPVSLSFGAYNFVDVRDVAKGMIGAAEKGRPGEGYILTDEVVTVDGEDWLFIDTAGIKRRLHKLSGAEYFSSLRTQAAIERSELALVLFDASQPISDQDLKVMSQAVDAGRCIVLVFNKWDLMDEFDRQRMERLWKTEFNRVTWAQRVNLSAKTGWHTNRLANAMRGALASWDKRIPTGKLNAFLGKIQAAHPHPLRGGKQPRILFATQASTRPPRFVIFATGFLEHGYRRYIERCLREEFGFEGSPIQISVNVREKKKRK